MESYSNTFLFLLRYTDKVKEESRAQRRQANVYCEEGALKRFAGPDSLVKQRDADLQVHCLAHSRS